MRGAVDPNHWAHQNYARLRPEKEIDRDTTETVPYNLDGLIRRGELRLLRKHLHNQRFSLVEKGRQSPTKLSNLNRSNLLQHNDEPDPNK